MGTVPAPKAPSANNALLNPNAALSGQGLLGAATSLANASTLGPITELAKQIAQNNARTGATQKLTSGYFNQLGNLAKLGVGGEKQIASDLNAQLAQIGQGTQNQLSQIGQGALQDFQKYNPGGTGTAGLGSLSQEIARQQGLAAQGAGAFKSFGAQQGANARTLASSQLGTFAQQGQQDLANIARSGAAANVPLQNRMAGLQAQRGALISTNIGKLRQQEIANRIAQTGLGIKLQTANQSTAQSNINNLRTTRASAANNAANLAARQQADLWAHQDRQASNAIRAAQQAATGRGGPKPLPISQQTTLYGGIEKIAGLISYYQQHGLGADPKDPTGKKQIPYNGNSARTVLNAHFPQWMTDAAFALKGWGFVTPQIAATMHSHGLRGGMWNGKPIRVQMPPPNPANGFGDISPGGLNSPH